MANSAFSEAANDIVGKVRGLLAQKGYNHDIGTLAALVIVEAMLRQEDAHLGALIELEAWNWYDEKTVKAHVAREVDGVLKAFLGENNEA